MTKKAKKGPLVTLKFCIWEHESRDVFIPFFSRDYAYFIDIYIFLCCLNLCISAIRLKGLISCPPHKASVLFLPSWRELSVDGGHFRQACVLEVPPLPQPSSNTHTLTHTRPFHTDGPRQLSQPSWPPHCSVWARPRRVQGVELVVQLAGYRSSIRGNISDSFWGSLLCKKGNTHTHTRTLCTLMW